MENENKKRSEEEEKEEIFHSPTDWEEDSDEDSDEFKTLQSRSSYSKSIIGSNGLRYSTSEILREYEVNERICKEREKKERRKKEERDKIETQDMDCSFYKEVTNSGGKTVLSVEGLSGTGNIAVGGYSNLTIVNFLSGETVKRLDLSEILNLDGTSWDIYVMHWVKNTKILYLIIYQDLYSLDIERETGKFLCQMYYPNHIRRTSNRKLYLSIQELNDTYLGVIDHISSYHLYNIEKNEVKKGKHKIYRMDYLLKHPCNENLMIYGGDTSLAHAGVFISEIIHSLEEGSREKCKDEVLISTGLILVGIKSVENERDGLLVAGFRKGDIWINDLGTRKRLHKLRCDAPEMKNLRFFQNMLVPDTLVGGGGDRMVLFFVSDFYRMGVIIDFSKAASKPSSDHAIKVVQRRKHIRDVRLISWLTDENLVYLTTDDCGCIKAWRNLFRVNWKDELERIKVVHNLVTQEYDYDTNKGDDNILQIKINVGSKLFELPKFFLL